MEILNNQTEETSWSEESDNGDVNVRSIEGTMYVKDVFATYRIEFDVRYKSYINYDPGDYYTPGSWIYNGEWVDVEYIEVFKNDYPSNDLTEKQVITLINKL